MYRDTALLLFTRSVEEEAYYKAFSKDDHIKTNQNVARYLISETKKTLLETELPVYVIDSKKQIGSTFGERFANAFQQVFDEGYQKVISVGNDCPELSSGHIISSANKLQESDWVIGPTPHGGAYLIGIHKHVFDKEQFQALNWQTAVTFTDLIDQIKNSGQDYTQLILLSDVNSFTALRRILVHGELPEAVIRKFKSILSSVTNFFLRVKIIVPEQEQFRNSISLRAPPLA